MSKRQKTIAALWEAYSKNKEEQHKLKIAIKDIEDKLLEHAKDQDLFEGQTATFENGRKIRKIVTPRVKKDKDFDINWIAINHPRLVKRSINALLLKKAYEEDPLKRSQFKEKYNIDLELKETHKYE